MTIRQIVEWWDRFWFEEKSPVPVALFRITFGLTMLQYATLLAPELINWFGKDGIVSVETCKKVMYTPCINLIAYLPADDSFIVALFVIFMVASLGLTFGLFTRVSTFLVFVILVSFHHRNTYIINSGDVLMACIAFYLLFCPAGHCLSLDRLIRIWRGAEVAGPPRLASLWGQRMIQLQLAAIYCQATFSKMLGMPWLDGTALYWVFRQKEFWRFPVPVIPDSLILCRILSWGTLLIEGSLFTVIWIREFRYWVLTGAVMLHLGIDYAMNLPMFETLMIFLLINFVYAEDLTWLMNKLKLKITKIAGAPVALLYDSKSLFSSRLAEILKSLDIFGRFEFECADQITNNIEIPNAKKTLEGFRAFRQLSLSCPLLWLILPVFYLPVLSWASNHIFESFRNASKG